MSFAKHFRSKKHSKNVKREEKKKPEWLFQEPIVNKLRERLNPEPFKQKTREDFETDDKKINKELSKKMINLYYFTDRALQVRFNITLDSRRIKHA